MRTCFTTLIAIASLAVGAAVASAQQPITAEQVEQITAAIRSAKPGDNIALPAGTYKDVQIVFDAVGEKERTITLRAAEPGKSVFTGTSSLTIAGQHLVVDGVSFTGPRAARTPPISFADGSSDCRLTNSAVVDVTADFDTRFHYVRVGGTRHRVDHCLLAGKTNMGPMLAAAGGATHVRIDHNHFRDFPHNPKNGRETIQIMGIGANDEPLDAGGAHWLVERNLFERAHGEGAEIVSIKSNHNLVRRNTIRATKGALTMRSGGGNTFDGNWIYGDGMDGTGGLRVSGTDAKAVNNYIAGVTGTAIQLHAGEYIEKDVSGGYEPLLRKGSPLGRVAHYLHLKNGVVANNLVLNATGVPLEFGSGYGNRWPGQQMILLPDNLVFANNIFATYGDASRATIKLHLGDDKAEKLPADARPRPVQGKNNFLYRTKSNTGTLPEQFGFRTDDPRLVFIDDANPPLAWPGPDSPALAGGFDPRPFQHDRPLTADDVGPDWARPKPNPSTAPSPG